MCVCVCVCGLTPRPATMGRSGARAACVRMTERGNETRGGREKRWEIRMSSCLASGVRDHEKSAHCRVATTLGSRTERYAGLASGVRADERGNAKRREARRLEEGRRRGRARRGDEEGGCEADIVTWGVRRVREGGRKGGEGEGRER